MSIGAGVTRTRVPIIEPATPAMPAIAWMHISVIIRFFYHLGINE